MAINPALREFVSDDVTPRELVLDYVCDVLHRVNESESDFDVYEEAMRLLEEVEKRCVGRVKGELIFADPRDANAFIEGGPFA